MCACAAAPCRSGGTGVLMMGRCGDRDLAVTTAVARSLAMSSLRGLPNAARTGAYGSMVTPRGDRAVGVAIAELARTRPAVFEAGSVPRVGIQPEAIATTSPCSLPC